RLARPGERVLQAGDSLRKFLFEPERLPFRHVPPSGVRLPLQLSAGEPANQPKAAENQGCARRLWGNIDDTRGGCVRPGGAAPPPIPTAKSCRPRSGGAAPRARPEPAATRAPGTT